MKKNKIKSSFDLSFYVSADAQDKRYGSIYAGMLRSPAYRALSHNARLLLITAIVHCSTTKNYICLIKYCEMNDIDFNKFYKRGMFILSSTQLEEYDIRSKHIARHWRELIDKGFIDCVHNNRYRKQYNVYILSTKWKSN